MAWVGEKASSKDRYGDFPLQSHLGRASVLSLIIVTMVGQEKAKHCRATFAGELDNSKKHTVKISWWGGKAP